MSSRGVSLVFSPNQASLYSADEECNIYEWDIVSGRCRQKLKEPWSVRIQCLAISANEKAKLAIGSSTGNIDVFDVGAKLSAEPNHSIGNLTTRIDALRFSSDGQILAAASRLKPGAMKLVHTGTMTVFQNWPTQRTPLHRVSALDFSCQGGVLAVGNEAGRVKLTCFVPALILSPGRERLGNLCGTLQSLLVCLGPALCAAPRKSRSQ
ncbi:unnamed protein product [Symbiodinium pilosum]|uniref:Uncharacterized protein n=1 Tax=Symbiodinium pilosum TaxID=2952 RepID=A0A812Y019_SYMPI|nr:unnamed protein product [Symbiodinium pilosum]